MPETQPPAETNTPRPARRRGPRAERWGVIFIAALGAGYGSLVFSGAKAVDNWIEAGVVIVVLAVAGYYFLEPLAEWIKEGPGSHAEESPTNRKVIVAAAAALLVAMFDSLIHESMKNPLGYLATVLELLVFFPTAGWITSSWILGARRRPSRAATEGLITGAILGGAIACFIFVVREWLIFAYSNHAIMDAAKKGMEQNRVPLQPFLFNGYLWMCIFAFAFWTLLGFFGGLAVDKSWSGTGWHPSSRPLMGLIAGGAGIVLLGLAMHGRTVDIAVWPTLFVVAGWGGGLFLNRRRCDPVFDTSLARDEHEQSDKPHPIAKGFLAGVSVTIAAVAFFLANFLAAAPSIGIDPAEKTVQAGGTTKLTATLYSPMNDSIAWKTDNGSLTQEQGDPYAVNYTAPNHAGENMVMASAPKVQPKPATARVIVQPPAGPEHLAIDPPAPTVPASGQQQFRANAAVDWHTIRGTITNTGLYTAPPEDGKDTVTAIERDNGARSADAPVTITPPSLPAMVVPAGTPVTVRMIDSIDSDRNQRGQEFRASVELPVRVQGQVMVPRNADARVRLEAAQSAGRVQGRSELRVSLVSLSLHGTPCRVETALVAQQAPSRTAETVQSVGKGASLGAKIGGLFHKKKAVVAGAAAGGGAALTAQLMTHGKQVKIASETPVKFTLTKALDPNSCQ